MLPGAVIAGAGRVAGAPAAVLPLGRAALHLAPQLRAHAALASLRLAEGCAACSLVCKVQRKPINSSMNSPALGGNWQMVNRAESARITPSAIAKDLLALV